MTSNHLQDSTWPFDSNIGRVGFPLDLARIESCTGPDGLTELIQLHDSPLESLARNVTRRLIFDCLGALGTENREPTLPSAIVDRLREIFFHGAPLEHFHYGVLAALFQNGFDEGDWPRLVERAANESILFGTSGVLRGGPPGPFLASVLRGFLSQSAGPGFLRILSVMAGECQFDLGSIPSTLLSPDLYEQPRDKVAAIHLRLCQGNCPRGELTRFAHIIAGLKGAYWIHRILESLENWQSPNCDYAYFASEFIDNAESRWEGAVRVETYLHDELRGRTSGLEDEAVWKGLKLPNL